MAVSGHSQIRPDLIRNDIYVIFLVKIHQFPDFPLFPYTAGRIVRRTENGGVDTASGQLLLQIPVVDPPRSLLILYQWIQEQVPAIVLCAVRKTDIGGRLDHNGIARLAQNLQGAHHSAQHTVLISDTFLRKTRGAKTLLMPPDDAVKIRFCGLKIPVSRMCSTLRDCFGNLRESGKIHVRHPHGDHRKTVLYFRVCEKAISAAGTWNIHRYGVLSKPVHNCRKVVLHTLPSFLSCQCCPLLNGMPRSWPFCRHGFFRRCAGPVTNSPAAPVS